MSDSLTLQLVAIETVKEGIKFLYGQATEALKRWRERKDTPDAPSTIITENKVPAIFAGQLQPPVIHLDSVGTLEAELKQVRSDLRDYVDGIEDIALDNASLLEEIDALRRMLEAIYQQRLTFIGEARSSSGPIVQGEVRAEEIAGYVAGVRARAIQSGNVYGKIDATRVAAGGQVVGVDIDTIG